MQRTTAELRLSVTALLLFALSSSQAEAKRGQASRDTLSDGVVVASRVSFERAQQRGVDYSIFTVDDGTTLAQLRVSMSYVPRAGTLSATLYRALIGGGFATVRLADRRPGGADQLRPDEAGRMATCRPEPFRRDSGIAMYTLRCVNSVTDDMIKTPSGGIVAELDVVLHTREQSSVDRFVGDHAASGKLFYIRLES